MAKFGSLQNELMGKSTNPEPEIGMGATVLSYTDRHGGTVVSWNPEQKILVVQEDKATRVDERGMSDAQSYSYERNTDGRTWTFRRSKDGKFFEVHRSPDSNRLCKVSGGKGLLLGVRETFHDFSF